MYVLQLLGSDIIDHNIMYNYNYVMITYLHVCIIIYYRWPFIKVIPCTCTLNISKASMHYTPGDN